MMMPNKIIVDNFTLSVCLSVDLSVCPLSVDMSLSTHVLRDGCIDLHSLPFIGLLHEVSYVDVKKWFFPIKSRSSLNWSPLLP